MSVFASVGIGCRHLHSNVCSALKYNILREVTIRLLVARNESSWPMLADSDDKGGVSESGLSSVNWGILPKTAAIFCTALALSACAISSAPFQPSNRFTAEFVSDDSMCRREAEVAANSATEQAERYDNGRDAEIIGAGLGGLMASAKAAKQQYRGCMRARGYLNEVP